MLLGKFFYSQEVDAALFLLAKQDDVNAFKELYTRYWPELVNAAYKRLNSKEKAEDIVQNIFVDLYQRRTSIVLTTSLKAYLNQALKFKILNEYRSAVIRTKYQRFLFFSPACKNDFAEGLEAKELEMKIHLILSGLPEKCKQVFLLSRKENLSNKDISATLDITLSTVEKHISKALKILKQYKF
jgi:RNA polymerase sigma-70 factor (ECF subfamily)